MKKYRIAIVGATGMVGRAFLRVLEERKLPAKDYTLFASARSAGSTVDFMGKSHVVKELTETAFDEGFDIALFSAGGSISLNYAPIAAAKGCVVIDNSSAWRMDPSVPLVVPEVNPEDVKWNKGIIANPNCSTIQAVVALAPLAKQYGLKRVVYSTYQAVSGAGIGGVKDLENTSRGENAEKFAHPIYNNCLPHIDVFLDNGYTKEEVKMIEETRKILHDGALKVTATCVRVPVINGHSESINVELEKPFEIEEIKSIFKDIAGIVVYDDISKNEYPLASVSSGQDEVFVGRIRRDNSVENGLNLWVVADNVRKGAATNAVQIAEKLIELECLADGE